MKRRIPIGVAVFTALAAFALGACGDDATDTSSDTTTEADSPQRIVSLSPSLTETLFAVGAGDKVVAVDEYSNYPDDAPTTALSGFTPNVEAIVKYEPDLVLLSDDIDGIVAKLEGVGIKTLQLPAATDIDDAYAQIEKIGVATGNVAEAAEVVLDMQNRIAAAIKKAPTTPDKVTYYHELDNTLFSVTSKSFVGEVYSLFGLTNIADPADTTGGGYPQLTAEFVVDADPDLVFLADSKCCNATPQTFAARPGFATLSAVKDGTVIAVDDDIASRWGPRIADMAESISEALQKRSSVVKAA